jgi:hypothetical protein
MATTVKRFVRNSPSPYSGLIAHPCLDSQCETTQGSAGSRVYPWLIFDRREEGESIIDKFAKPKPYYVPQKGEF